MKRFETTATIDGNDAAMAALERVDPMVTVQQGANTDNNNVPCLSRIDSVTRGGTFDTGILEHTDNNNVLFVSRIESRTGFRSKLLRLGKQDMSGLTAAMRDAAEHALSRGWSIFAAPACSKVGRKGTHGSKDALNTQAALDPWNLGKPFNPCVRLDKSGLIVLDLDKHPFRSFEDVEQWADLAGIPLTLIVKTARGYHLYFTGKRGASDVKHSKGYVKDVTQNPTWDRAGFLWEEDGIRVQGDIKYHGHVVIEGGLGYDKAAKRLAFYRGNGRPIAPVPESIREYRDPKDKKSGFINAKQDELLQEYGRERIGKGHRYKTLVSEAGHLRAKHGLGERALFHGLQDFARLTFVDAESWIAENDARIQQLARDAQEWKFTRVVQPTEGTIVYPPSPTAFDETYQKILAIDSSAPLTREQIRERGGIAASNKTLLRAMKEANFVEVGRAKDGRKPTYMKQEETSKTGATNDDWVQRTA